MNKKRALGIILFFILQVGFAQEKAANKYFESFQFEEAIPLYLKALKKEKDSLVIKNLAESYRQIHDYENAEIYYKRAAELFPNDNEIQLKYGEVLKNNRKLDRAKEVFVVYANKFPNDPTGKNYILSCDRIRSWSIQSSSFEVENEEELNSENSDFSPIPYGDGVAFVSDRFTDNSDATGAETTGILSIAVAEMKEDSSFKKPKPISNIINNDFHNGPICFSRDLSEAYFTRVEYTRKKGHDFLNKPQIYVSKKIGNKWSKPEPFEHNDLNYTFSQPSLSPDGSTLIFVSDMEVTKGKLDLFYCTKEDGGWSKPKNMGNKINTKENEMFPTITKDTLYFSSNGHQGYGGLDIFISKKINGDWSTPENLKEPINSPRDDFGLVFTDETHGFFSSNREGGKGEDDIYRFELKAKQSKQTEINGMFVYSELDPAKNELVQLFDEDGNMISKTTTNEDGSFKFTGLKSDKNYIFRINENNPKLNDLSQIYLTNEKGEKVVTLNQLKMGEFHFRALEPDEISKLEPIDEDDVQLTFVNIFGQLYDKLPNDYQEVMEIYLVDDDGEIIYTTYTDKKGKFAFPNQLSNQDYKIRIANDTTDLNLIFLNEKGEKVSKAQKIDNQHYIFLSKDIYVGNRSRIFGRVYSKLPGDYTESIRIYLVNDAGFVIKSSLLDENGNFSFDNLQEHRQYKIRLENDPKLKVEFTDEKGNKLANARKVDEKHFIFLTRDLYDPKTTEIFGKIYQKLPGDYSGGMEVFLVNDEGEVVYTTISDANGEFHFENLPSDEQYAIRLKELDSEYKVLVLDEEGDPQKILKKLEKGTYRYTVEEQKDNSLFGKVYETLPGDYSAGMEVYLVDEEGKIVYTTNLDKDGNFNFENLPPDHNFTVRLQQTGDDLNMIVLNEYGEVETKAKQTAEGDFVFERDENADKTGLFGNIFKELPGDFSGGLEVYLVDDDGNIVYKTVTDEDGNFNFENLPPDHNFKIKLKNEVEDFQMVVLDNSGKLKAVNESENGYIIEKEEKRQLLGNIYRTIPGDFDAGMEIVLLDDEGNVVFRTKTDENGNFAFKNLPADRHFVVKLIDTLEDVNMVILNEEGEMLSSAKANENGIFDPEPIKPEQESIFGKAYKELPGDFSAGMEVFLVDDGGNIVYTTTTDENGDFVFENLPSDKHYAIKFNTEDPDMKVLFLDENGKEAGAPSVNKNGDFEYNYLGAKKEYISLLTENDAVIKIVDDNDFIMFTINFDYDKAQVRSKDRDDLNKLAKLMNKNPHISVKINAYADSKGSNKYNLNLTQKRANEAKAYLENKGVSQNRIIAKGYGEKLPVAPNTLPDGSDNPKGRAKNRRAEIRIIKTN